MSSKQIIEIILLILYYNCVVCDENNVKVRVKLGEIVGKIETPLDGIRLNVFRGIPYAKPPIGELRFRRPVPIESWTEPIEAFGFGASCVQNLSIFGIGEALINKEISEDCLFLNVWSPDQSLNSSEALKAVMVWIHGGGLFVGGAGQEEYQGDILAAKGDVVVVSMNYRFLYKLLP